MASFITKYRVQLEVIDSNLLGCIVGDRGNSKTEIERSTGATISIQNKFITINGKTMSEVKLADAQILKLLEEHTFVVFISVSQAGRLIGKDLETLKSIQNQSGAHVAVHKNCYANDRRKLEVFGRSEAFDKAKELIFNILGDKIEEDLKYDVPHKCYRQVTIEQGEYNGKYVEGQLPSNPSLLFMQFVNNLASTEELYNTKKLDLEGRKNPPASLSKNCGILAPYQKFLYRAQVLGLRRTTLSISLLVKFVDFGNVSVVDYFQCQDLPKKNLYPPYAVACELNNIKQEEWKEDIIGFFRQYVNNFTKNVRVKVLKTCSSKELIPVKLAVQNVGDIGALLVAKGASWKDSPFEPIILTTTENSVGSSDMVYESGGWGGTTRIDIVSTTRIHKNEDKYTYTSHFETQTMLNSMKTAYSFCKQFLEKKNITYLNTHTLHISAENNDLHQYEYNGPSAGAVLALCMISECLKLEIPGNVSVTGQISGHGDLHIVGCLREKVLGASKQGKTNIFVPEGNALEALDIKVNDLTIRPIKDMDTLISCIWSNKL